MFFFFFFDDEELHHGESLFDSIKHVNEYEQEYCTARELFTVLGYKQWRDFKKVIERAVRACKTSDNKAYEHFARTRKTSPMPNGGVKEAVRNTIKELGGTMPEDLPTPDKSIMQLEREQAKQLKDVDNKKSNVQKIHIAFNYRGFLEGSYTKPVADLNCFQIGNC